MGLIVETPVQIGRQPGRRISAGNGSGNFTHGSGNSLALDRNAPPPGNTAIWVGIATIGMMFAALTSALVVRQGASNDWRHFDLPEVLYLNTLVLAFSSITLEAFRAHFRRGLSSHASLKGASRWLYATITLGVIFIFGQYVAWHQLNNEGLYLASNPSHSFFYVLTGAHVLHLLGGIIALLYVTAKLKRRTLRSSTLAVATKYWHFMDLLWLYLLGLLWLKL